MVRLVFIAVFLAGVVSTTLAGSTVFNDPEISVYPNPFKQEIKIDLSDIKSDVNIEVTDLLGNLILKKEIPNTGIARLDLSNKNLKPGVYIINLKTEEFSISKRLVKQ